MKLPYLRFVIISLLAIPDWMPVSVKEKFATNCQEARIVAKHRLVAGHETQIPEMRWERLRIEFTNISKAFNIFIWNHYGMYKF